MITLYEVIPGPSGEFGVYGRLAVDHPPYETWHAAELQAVTEAKRLCAALVTDGRLNRPGDKVIVVSMNFATVQCVARRRPITDSRQLVVDVESAEKPSWEELDKSCNREKPIPGGAK